MLTIEWMNQEWGLHTEKALFWTAKRTVIVADVHFGKAAAFRHHGVPVPEATTARDLARLSTVIHDTCCTRLIVLGDLIHAEHGRAEQTMLAIRNWRDAHPAVDMTLVRGNHDLAAGDPPSDWRCECVAEPFEFEGVRLQHDPALALRSERKGESASFAGHVHPCVRLRDVDGTSMRVPCFIFSERSALLPAFGSFTGTHPVKPRKGDRVFAVGPDQVMGIEPAFAAQ